MSEKTLDAHRVVDGPAPSVLEAMPVEWSSDLERRLSEVLAEVMEVDEVPVAGDFFDDLGADSLVMAHFCARLRKRDDLPSVSIKEVYQHPTIAGLAMSLADADPAVTNGSAAQDAATRLAGPPGPASSAAATEAETRPLQTVAPVATWQYVLCGVMQLLTLFEFTYLMVWIIARSYDWIADGSGSTAIYLRSALVSGSVFVGWCIVPIAAKWLIIGRWKQRQFGIWSLEYVAFWFVKFLVQSNPLVRFTGSPLYLLYLRALGAKIGRGVVILSGTVPVCTDLLTIGDNAVVRKDSIITCYRASAGLIETGPVTLGADSLVGEATVLDIGSSLGDRAQLGHASALQAGQSIPDGERWVGSPAGQRTNVDYRAVAPTARSSARRVIYSVVQVLFLFTVTLPLLIVVPLVLVSLPAFPDVLLGLDASPFSGWTFYREILVASLVLFFGFLALRLCFALLIPPILSRAIRPHEVYPLYGVRFWAYRTITRLTNLRFFTNLFGDTSYIVHYLYLLGYDVSFKGQTGANFGLNVKHDTPYHVTVGQGTMAADGLSIINTDYSNTSFRISPITIGSRSFFGNQVAYSPLSKVGDNCLLATKVQVPVEGEVRGDVGFLGSPSFEIPRLVMRDRKFDAMKTEEELGPRLAAKNKHNAVTMILFVLTRWLALLSSLVLASIGVLLYPRLGPAVIGLPVLALTLLGSMYYVLVERAATGFRPLRPLYCSMYEPDSWRVERYWKLSWQPSFLNGTPLKSLFWRLLGVKIGRRVFDDGCLMIDKTLIAVGDDCSLNIGSVIQPHSQEDGSFKSDHVAIANGCTLGVGSLVHYGVSMGEGATLDAGAFLMKGAEVTPHTWWSENPAREVGDGHRDVAVRNQWSATMNGDHA